jgi:hypothetical protein
VNVVVCPESIVADEGVIDAPVIGELTVTLVAAVIELPVASVT